MSAFLLVIPWLGYQYILEMEEYLRRGQEQTVLGTAQALATALNERPELFDEGSYEPARRTEDLYVYPIFSALSSNSGSLYAYFKVRDDVIVYRSRDSLRVNRSDFLRISMLSREGNEVKHYIV